MMGRVAARRNMQSATIPQQGSGQRRRRSVLDSTRNLMASLKHEDERNKNSGRNKNSKHDQDPIEQFLRRVDTATSLGRNANGIEIDTEDDYLPSCLRCFMKPLSKCILIPDAPGRLAWDVLVGTMIMYYLILVPLRLAFDVTNPGVPLIQTSGVFLAIEILFDFMFIFDLAVNFRTAFHDSGELVTDPHLIAFAYLRGWFWLDLLSSLPTTLITLANSEDVNSGEFDPRYNQILRSLKWIKLLKLMRVLRLKRITERFEHIAMFWNAGTLRLFRSILLAIIVWHLVACMYFAVSHNLGFCEWADGNNETDYEGYRKWDQGSGRLPNGFQDCYDDWVPWNEIVNQPFGTQYGQAFFWAVMVTTGVGKDINPQSDAEVAFTCFAIMVGVFMFSIIIGSLSSAIQSMDHKSNVHNQQLERINHFMKFNKVPHYMQVAIHQFYEYKWGRPETDPPFSDLPNILKIRLKVLLNREALLEVPVFKELPPDCMIALTQHIKSHTVFPTEFSTHQGSHNSILFIIRHGRMQLTRHPLKVSAETSTKGKWKALLRRWQANEKKRRNSLANTALTAFRDAFILTTQRRKDDHVVTELSRGNFFGVNCLIDAPEDFSCSAIVFSEVLMLDMSSSALKLILEEYPIMRRKLTKFAEDRRKKIQKQILSEHGITRSKSLFGGSGDDSSISEFAKQKRREILQQTKSSGSIYSVSSETSDKNDDTLLELEKGISNNADGENNEEKIIEMVDTASPIEMESTEESKEEKPTESLIKTIGKNAIAKKKSNVNGFPSDSATNRKIRELENTVNEIRRVQDAQYQATMEKLEELLANIYV
jgi:CRP-like cAMP-binding protein